MIFEISIIQDKTSVIWAKITASLLIYFLFYHFEGHVKHGQETKKFALELSARDTRYCVDFSTCDAKFANETQKIATKTFFCFKSQHALIGDSGPVSIIFPSERKKR